MKQKLLVLLFALLPALLYARQPGERVCYLSVDLWWNSDSAVWINSSRNDYLYDDQGNQVEEIYSQWDETGSRWGYLSGYCWWGICEIGKVTFEYDALGNLIRYSEYGWDSETEVWWEFHREESVYDAEGRLVSSKSYYNWDGAGELIGDGWNQWEYDADGNLIRESYSWWNDGMNDWIHDWQETYSYTQDGQIEEEMSFYWDEQLWAWNPSSRHTFTYNEEGKQIYILEYRGDGNPWLIGDSTVFRYDSAGLPTEEQLYYLQDNPWETDYLKKRTFNTNGFVIEEVTSYLDWELGIWINSDRNVYDYDPDGNQLEHARYWWDQDVEDWRGSYRELDSYTQDGLREQSVRFDWDEESWGWIERDRRDYLYDSLQHLISETRMSWDEGSGSWNGSSKTTYSYDLYGNRTSQTTYYFDESLSEWVPETKNESYWAPIGSRPVYIPDQALMEALLANGVDSNGDLIITYPEAEATEALDISGYGINYLSGLEAFVNLDTFICWNNPLRKLDLSPFPQMRYLDCQGCDLDDLDVSPLEGLTTLICSQNRLKKLDLAGNIQLKELDLSQMPELHEVCVWESPFPPEGFELNTENSPKITITADCSVMIPDQSLYRALLDAGVDANGDSLINRSEAVATTELDLSGYGIENLAGLEAFSNLQKLDCSDNPLYNLDLSTLQALSYLNCSRCNLAGLDLSENLDLTTLICRGNSLYELDVRRNGDLTFLDCAGNYIGSLELFNNVELRYIDISGMPFLGEICVWRIPFPTESIEVVSDYNPNFRYTSECGLTKDRYEDNDVLNEAVTISESQVYEGLTVSEYDGDWFRLIPESEILPISITVQCSFLHSEGDINLDIVSTDGTVVASAESRNDDETVSIPANPMEGLYIHVYLDSGQFNDYSLQWISGTYATNSTLQVCDPASLCMECRLDSSARDTVYTLDTLYVELNTGDSVSRNIPIQNTGPESYAFYTSVDCSGMLDGRNYAMKFDGIDDRVLINRSAYIDLSEEITLEAWVWFEDGDEGMSPIVSRMISGYGYELFSATEGEEINVGFRFDGGRVVSNRNLSAHRWYHLAATYDSRAIRLYIDGIKDCERDVTGPISVANQWLVIGANSPMEMNQQYFEGEIDEVRIWNRARSAIQIQCFYQRQLDGSEEGLAGYWNMDHQYESVVIDLTNHNKGYIDGEAIRVPSEAPSERLLQIEPVSVVIPAGSVYQFQIGVNAEHFTGGVYGINVNLYSNIKEKPDIRIPVLIRILDAPSIRVTPDGVAFGNVEMYRTYSTDLEVSNTGSELLTVDSIGTGMPGSRITPSSFTLLPGESRNVTLDFFTRFAGSYEGTLRFYSNDPSDPVVEITTYADAAGMSNFAYLFAIRDTLQPGGQIMHILKFEVPDHNCGLTMTHSLRYLTLPGLCYDQIPREDSGQWVLPVLSSMVILHPDSVLDFAIVLNASGLSIGEYYAELVLEWYNPSRNIGFIPISLVVGPTGTAPAAIAPEGKGLLLFPNPTNGMLTVRTNENEPFDLLIMTVDGHVLRQLRVHDPEVQLDVSNLHPGLYLVIMRTGQYVSTRKFIRQ